MPIKKTRKKAPPKTVVATAQAEYRGKLPQGSLDGIFADPPYSLEWVSLNSGKQHLSRKFP